MSSDVTVTKTGPKMKCSICQRSPHRINLSSCFHSFCPDCLQSSVHNAGQHTCPICRTAVNVSETNTGNYSSQRDVTNSGVINLRDGSVYSPRGDVNVSNYSNRETNPTNGYNFLGPNNGGYSIRENVSPGGISSIHLQESSRSQFGGSDGFNGGHGQDIVINSIPASSPRNSRSYLQTLPGGGSRDNIEVTRTYIPATAGNGNGSNMDQFRRNGTRNETGLPPMDSRVNYISTAPSSAFGNENMSGLEVIRTRIPASSSPNFGQFLPPITDTGNQSQRSATSPGTGLSQVCDICQDGRKAVSWCVQCEQSFCQICRVAHLKMKASRQHEQQPIKGQGQQGHGLEGQGQNQGQSNQGHLQGQGNMPSRLYRSRTGERCRQHGNEITHVCKRCDELICDTCKSISHVGHVTKLVSEEANEVRKNLTVVLQRQITLSERLRTQLIETERRKEQYPLDLRRELDKLNHQVDEMRLEIEREKEKSENELTKHCKEYIDRNDEMYVNTHKNYDELMSMKSEALNMLNSNDDVYVAMKGTGLQRRLDAIERECKKDQQLAGPNLQFYQGEIDPGKIRNMFGGIASGNQRYESFPRLKSSSTMVLQSATSTPTSRSAAGTSGGTSLPSIAIISLPFTDGIGYVYGIAPVDANRAWVSLLGHSMVLLVDRTGKILRSTSVDDIAEDVAHDGMGGCFVTCTGRKCIKHVSHGGDVSMLIERLPQDPHGISVLQYYDTERNGYIQELFVCFTESRGTNTSLYDKPKGCVRTFANTGDDLGNTFLLQSPVRVDSNPDSNLLCISDHSNGLVTITDKTGQNVHALYTGSDEEDAFKPLGVCFDETGRVVIADWKAERVTRIAQDGSNPELLVRDVRGPQSVAVQDGVLWVGGKHGIVHLYNIS